MENINSRIIVVLARYWVFALCFAFNTVLAEEVPDLYDVELPVSSQQQGELTRASKIALNTVFARVSAGQTVTANPKIKAAIANAQKYMKQFQYVQHVDELTGVEQLYVILEFERKLVDGILRDAGLSLWSENRPTILLWLTVEDIKGRRFVTEESDPEIFKAILYHATQRGLAVKLPLFDLEDTLAVEPDEAWNLNNWRVQTAVKRYATDTVLLGRFSHLSNGQLFGKWLYQFDSQQKNYDAQSNSINEYIGAGLNLIADIMASEYAVAPVDIADNGVIMRLTGVDDFVDYAKAIAYLENITSIRHANVIQVDGSEIIVRLIADGLLSQLQQVFKLDNKLVSNPESNYLGEYTISLDYQWPYQ